MDQLSQVSDEFKEIVRKGSIRVLDHGFVRVVDYMGGDSSIVQAARVSYGNHGEATKGEAQDKALIRYLMRHSHTSPFEMCEIKLHIKCPLFVARQWLRHRTASVNEISARYTEVKDCYYLPNIDDIGPDSKDNHQGRDLEDSGFTWEDKAGIRTVMQASSVVVTEDYQYLMKGYSCSKELARIILPQNMYTEFYWKIDLHNLLHFLRLRADSHAQYEIREYARVILDIVKAWVPVAYDSFMDYKVNAKVLTNAEGNAIKELLAENPDLLESLLGKLRKTTAVSKRELKEFEGWLTSR